jgi:pyruvate dehydrogenase E2 component (dihydrolipoamide acetyltransferase)
MTNAIALRDKIKNQVMSKYGVFPSINDIIVKCTAMALADNPRINCSFTENEIIIKKDINIGIAVALDEGLIVPVIKSADQKSIGEIAYESKQLVHKARNGELMSDEYKGGTFTISSLAGFGITQCTSIINQPESAILSVGKAVYQPIAVDQEIVIKPIMNLTLNYDHRPIDGSKGAIFLNGIKNNLEEPYGLLV